MTSLPVQLSWTDYGIRKGYAGKSGMIYLKGLEAPTVSDSKKTERG